LGGGCWLLGGECWVMMNCCDGRWRVGEDFSLWFFWIMKGVMVPKKRRNYYSLYTSFFY